MWFIGMLAGFVVGALLGEIPGALAGAVLGWILALVFFPKKAGPAAVAGGERLAQVEGRLARIEARLAALEVVQAGGKASRASVVPPEAAVAPTPAATERVVAAERTQIPAAPEVPSTRKEPAPAAVANPARAPVAMPEPRPNPLIAWLTGGNTIARVGAVILFVGVSFLVKYAADHRLLPIELRLAAVAGAAIAMLFFGWRMRESRRGYALTLQGVGVGIFYLTIFAAFRLYHLLPAGTAMAILVVTAALAAYLAVRQDAMALAVIGTVGGFLAPVLASTHSGNHVLLFSYYAVLNAAILAMAVRKSWRPLNLTGFVFTAGIGFLWGSCGITRWSGCAYHDGIFASTESFLVLFFLMYVTIAVLGARRDLAARARFMDATLVFGVPLVAFGFQAAMLDDSRFALAGSAVALSALYLALARGIHARDLGKSRVLVESFLALGMVFATLAIPLALEARWTSAAWALEGLGIVWAGARQGRWLARAFGLALQLLAGLVFLDVLSRGGLGEVPVLNGAFIGAFLLAIAGLASCRILGRMEGGTTQLDRLAVPAGFLWGLAWWLAGGAREIDRFLDEPRFAAAAAFLAGTALVSSTLRRRFAWPQASWPSWGLAPALGAVAAAAVVHDSSVLAHFGWAAWPFAFWAHLRVLRHDEPEITQRWLQALHVAGFLLLAAIGSWELHWLSRSHGLSASAWSVSAAMVWPALCLAAVTSARASARWPVQAFASAYLALAGAIVTAALWAWTFYANATHDGGSAPLPYLPVLNAIDLGHLLALAAGAGWWLALRRESIPVPIDRRSAIVATAGAAFFWLNAILLRTIHHWAGVAYRLDELMRSVLVQAALSLFWTAIALVLMFAATKRGWRAVWMTGALLLAIVVGKLLLVDLSHLSGIERIVSFIGVGLLMLLLGYLAPVPPKGEAK
ncbi:MAG: DUF2339 domain-containing protein [Betaproteobacteria bacterium]|nr:MAG: DUF2339 domain-containing protein [Betaproteobacteria bacterium]